MFVTTKKSMLVYLAAIFTAIAVLAINLFAQVNVVRVFENQVKIFDNETSQTLNYNDYHNLNYDISSLKNVTVLEINGNKSTEIPSFLFEQINLEKLTLNNFNINTLPFEIRYLYKLKYLDLANTNIDNLLDEISKLNNLKELHLSYEQWQYRINEVRKITRAYIILE